MKNHAAEFHVQTERFHRALILHTLAASAGSIAAAARALGMHRPYLHRLMRRHGIDRNNSGAG